MAINIVAQLIREAREADAKLARLDRNVRLGRYQGRNGEATARLMDSLQARRDAAVDALARFPVGTDAHRAAGLLTAEQQLRRRASDARDQGQDRPELAGRLLTTRRNLRGIVEAAMASRTGAA
jgi:hypothetical protein